MFEIQNYYSFVVAILLFQLVPGVGTIAILNATARNGVTSGMSAVFGTLLGDFIYMSSAVLGLAALLSSYPMIFVAAQYAGVVYLCYLGLKFVFAKKNLQQSKDLTKKKNIEHFKQALAVCLTNPKAIMFFMAFFPLFLRPDSRPVTLLVMMLHVTFLSFLYQISLVLVGNAVARYVSRWKYAQIVATRLAGIALIGFGLKLARSIK